MLASLLNWVYLLLVSILLWFADQLSTLCALVTQKLIHCLPKFCHLEAKQYQKTGAEWVPSVTERQNPLNSLKVIKWIQSSDSIQFDPVKLNANKLMYFDRIINGNKDGKILEGNETCVTTYLALDSFIEDIL